MSFPTYRAGSPRSLALLLDLCPSFYSCLFLVEKGGGGGPMIDLSHLNEFVLQTLF